MSAEKNRLLQLLFDNDFPAEWESDASFNTYINKIGTYNVEDLSKEPIRLREEENSILDQTQELAVSNYRTFIDTAECSRDLFAQFNTIDSKLDSLLEDIPEFENKCHNFAETTSGINNLRKLNSLTLTRNAQLLEILELPQLMNSFINDGLYDDALELSSYVRKLYKKHPDIPIFKSIEKDVEKAWLLMLHQLLSKLRDELTLPKCLEIVGHLRRMEVFTETELRLKFLQTRSAWLHSCLKKIPTDDANHHLNKTIEITRVNLFNIVTQYRAIFNDDDHSPLVSLKSQHVNQNIIFFSWISDQISDFLKVLEEDLERGVSSIDSILGQCMYFGLSFSKVGCDFRPLLIPVFSKTIFNNFESSVGNALTNFEKNIERFTLINKNLPNVPWKSKNEDPLQPPDSLLEFYPLAEFLNNLITAFNELRLCPPIAIITDLIKSVENALQFIAKSLLVLYGQEQQAFTSNSKDAFTRLCMSFADDLVPYTQKCIHTIYPPSVISSLLGVNVQTLQTESISFLNKDKIVEPIKHLLPVRIEASLSTENENKINDVKSEESIESSATITTSNIDEDDKNIINVDN